MKSDDPTLVKDLIGTLETVLVLTFGKSVISGVDRMIIRLVKEQLDKAKLGAS